MRTLISVMVLTGVVSGQEVRVMQEFQRPAPSGEIVKADSADPAVEVLSPQLARGAFNSFHISVQLPAGAEYELHIAQNPDDRVKPTMYREVMARNGEQWIADRLEKVELPVQTRFQPSDGAKVDVYWLDLWVGPDTPVERIRVEVQLFSNKRWTIYPMEPNVLSTVIPSSLGRKLAATPVKLPDITAPAASVATAAMNAAACPSKSQGAAPAQVVSVRTMLVRNAMQDAALYRVLKPAAQWDCAAGYQPGRYQKFRRSLWVGPAPASNGR